MPSTFDITINGERHTRRSDRVYTHAVVARRDEAKAREAAYGYQASQTDRRNFEWHSFVAAQVPGEHVRPPGWRFDTSYSAEEIAAAREGIANGFDAYVARLREQAIARFEAAKAGGAFRPSVYRWSMSLGNANRGAETAQRAGYRDVRVVPVGSILDLP